MKGIKRQNLPSKCYNSNYTIEPTSVVLHYISAVNVDSSNPFSVPLCTQILVDYGVSYHLLIARDREQGVTQYVDFDRKAYHAGKSNFLGMKNWNNHSIGLCLVGGKDTGFTQYQYDEVNWLYEYFKALFGIERWVSHEHIAKGRKIDIGIKSGNFDLNKCSTNLKTTLKKMDDI